MIDKQLQLLIQENPVKILDTLDLYWNRTIKWKEVPNLKKGYIAFKCQKDRMYFHIKGGEKVPNSWYLIVNDQLQEKYNSKTMAMKATKDYWITRMEIQFFKSQREEEEHRKLLESQRILFDSILKEAAVTSEEEHI